MNWWTPSILLIVIKYGTCNTANRYSRNGNKYPSNHHEIDKHETNERYPYDNGISMGNEDHIVKGGNLVDNMYPGERNAHNHGKLSVENGGNYMGSKDMKGGGKYERTVVGFGPLGGILGSVITGGTQLLGGPVGSALLGGAIGHVGNAVLNGAGHLGNVLVNYGPKVLGHVGNMVGVGSKLLGSIGNGASIFDNNYKGKKPLPPNGKPETPDTDSGQYKGVSIPNYPGGESSVIDWSKPIPTPQIPTHPNPVPPSTSKESGDTNHYIVHCIDDHAKSYKPGATYPVGDKCNNICTCKHRGQFDCTRNLCETAPEWRIDEEIKEKKEIKIEESKPLHEKSYSKESEDNNHNKYSKKNCIDAHGKSYNEGETYPECDECNNICRCSYGSFKCTEYDCMINPALIDEEMKKKKEMRIEECKRTRDKTYKEIKHVKEPIEKKPTDGLGNIFGGILGGVVEGGKKLLEEGGKKLMGGIGGLFNGIMKQDRSHKSSKGSGYYKHFKSHNGGGHKGRFKSKRWSNGGHYNGGHYNGGKYRNGGHKYGGRSKHGNSKYGGVIRYK